MGLETVELVITWERSFSISIPNSTAATLTTPTEAANAIDRLLAEEGRPLARAEIDRVIKATTLDIAGISESEYRLDGRFVEDFGLD
jgi:hypothetical protein